MPALAYARRMELRHPEHFIVDGTSADHTLAVVGHAPAEETAIAAHDPAAWQNFYVMTGGAAAALPGLAFCWNIYIAQVLVAEVSESP
jgi:hypothetical protein